MDPGGGPAGGGGGGDDGVTTPTDPDLDPSFPPDGFCADGGWAFCEDFDGRGPDGRVPADFTGTNLDYNQQDHTKMTGLLCEVSVDCDPYFQGGALFTNAEDAGFGWSTLRLTQPFDFSAPGGGHLRFTSNINATGRMNVGIILTPLATNAMPDNRGFMDNGVQMGAVHDAPAVAVKSFRTADQGGRVVADFQVWKDQAQQEYFPVNDELVIGFDHTIPHEYDVYVTRTHLQILVDGESILDREMQDIGFDRGYVYLAGLSYNAMKEDGVPHTAEANTMMWDNIAFDGPVLAPNSLTPEGSEDVLVRAYAVSGCTVQGVAAEGPRVGFYQNLWATWIARLPASAGTVTEADVTCALNPDWPRQSGPQWGQIEIVHR